MRPTRRRLLQALLGAAAADPSRALLGLGQAGHAGAPGPGSAESLSAREPEAPAAADPPADTDPEEATGTLTPAELAAVVALGEILAEGRVLAAGERRHLVEHVEWRARETPGHVTLYRITARVLDRLAGGPFAALDAARRSELMIRHRLTDPIVRPDENLGAFPEEVREVRARAAPDLVGGYYASPAGWAIVGYTVFPGRCGDLARYTRAEA